MDVYRTEFKSLNIGFSQFAGWEESYGSSVADSNSAHYSEANYSSTGGDFNSYTTLSSSNTVTNIRWLFITYKSISEKNESIAKIAFHKYLRYSHVQFLVDYKI